MTDMQAFLDEAVNFLNAMDDTIPIEPGRVLNPLHHLTQQLSVINMYGKTLKVVRNILMASVMLLCISTTFKPLSIQGMPSVDPLKSGLPQLFMDAVTRFVFDIHVPWLCNLWIFCEVPEWARRKLEKPRNS